MTTSVANNFKSTGTRRRAFATPLVREVPSRRTSGSTPTRPTSGQPVAANAALITAAGRGECRAWEQLIAEFSPMLRGIARSFRLAPADVDDVVQDTWIALHSNISTLRNADALPAWLATTVRRRSLRLLQAGNREQVTDDLSVDAADDQTPEKVLLETERRDVFAQAVGALPMQQRRVVTALAARPDLDYQQLASMLQMPIGSLGPTRARGLARLARNEELRFVHTTGA